MGDSGVGRLDLPLIDDGRVDPHEIFKVRPYQLEMLEESMKRNIIIAAETGSGKTLIAILRIRAALERCSLDHLVWFCVPSVALAGQQYKAITAQLPAFQARVLSGTDSVELWSEAIWKEVLKGIRIVVSTHQILLDALVHGFVRMHRLALIVFDEAHSCIGNHPSSRILRGFYHESSVHQRPAILGLTASPVVNSKVGNLSKLESNLNAISRTPKLHREDMLQYVHPPQLIKLTYPSNGLLLGRSQTLKSLQKVFEGLDIEQDPWIIKQRSDPHTRDSKALMKALMSGKTDSHEQIKTLYTKAVAINDELGPWATDYYIHQCIQKLQSVSAEGYFMLEDMEKLYLQRKLQEVEVPAQGENIINRVPQLSPKVETLIRFLAGEVSPNFSGLVFVKTRAEVAVLSHILSIHASSCDISTFVGASGYSGRKYDIGELVDVKNQKDTLDDLRYGRKNLVITTNALEEGIDVSRCSVVICFDKPPNLKSFIQRRGRARKSDSKYVIMFEEGPQYDVLAIFTALEVEMKKLYNDEMRRIEEVQKLEDLDEGDSDSQVLFVGNTGAKLTLDDAVQHLHHFCATLPGAPFVDRNPVFFFDDNSTRPGAKSRSILATVELPSSVDASVRRATGRARWITEKMAKRDAAFEAYKALYQAGLVTEHLLPVGYADEDVDEAYAAVEKRPSLVEVSELIDPWRSVALEWQDLKEIQGSPIRVMDGSKVCGEMILMSPCKLPQIAEFEIYWNADSTLRIVIEGNVQSFSPEVITQASQSTSLVLRSVFHGRMDDRSDFTNLFVPCHTTDIGKWAAACSGTKKAEDLCLGGVNQGTGIVRDRFRGGIRCILRDTRYGSAMDVFDGNVPDEDRHNDTDKTSSECKFPGNMENSESINSENKASDPSSMDLDQGDRLDACMVLDVTKFPRRKDFLHRSADQDARVTREAKVMSLLASNCEVDKLPLEYSLFAILIPSILHKIQVTMVVESLCEGLLAPLQFEDRSLVTTAISASSAMEGTDYQILEFLGDSILKFMTSVTLLAKHLNYHEGILSHKKDHIVSNSSLATAAILNGLDKYILTKAFTGAKWRPLYNEDLLQDSAGGKREMSSKTLADVVEALLGAAFLDGGTIKAIALLESLLPRVPWLDPSEACRQLYTVYDIETLPSGHVANIEQLIAHSFNAKVLLLEALSHQSYRGLNSSASYERLEFLGDSVLDNIVTRTAFAQKPAIPTPKLHLIRTALVNGNFLGYLCLQLSTALPRIDPVVVDSKNISTIETSYSLFLWQAMRHGSPVIAQQQKSCLERLANLDSTIQELLASGAHYPWTALARLEPPKFMSDIVESLIGAIFIDTQGSSSACEAFLEHLGLMSYLRRVMTEDVALLHPKEEFGQLANQDKVKYELGKEGEEGDQRLTCSVYVGERKLVGVGDGLSIMEVQTRAADTACGILRTEGASARNGLNQQDLHAGMEEQLEEQLQEEDEDESVGTVLEREEERMEDAGGRDTEEDDNDSDVYMTADDS